MSGHGRRDLLDGRGLGADCIIKRERAFQQCTGDLAAIRHLAQGSSFDRGGHLGGDRLHRAEDRHADLGNAHGVCQIDGVLDDVNLVIQGWRD